MQEGRFLFGGRETSPPRGRHVRAVTTGGEVETVAVKSQAWVGRTDEMLACATTGDDEGRGQDATSRPGPTARAGLPRNMLRLRRFDTI